MSQRSGTVQTQRSLAEESPQEIASNVEICDGIHHHASEFPHHISLAISSRPFDRLIDLFVERLDKVFFMNPQFFGVLLEGRLCSLTATLLRWEKTYFGGVAHICHCQPSHMR